MSESVSKFKRITAQLRGTAANDLPVPFDIPCECGHRIAGVRQTSWKQEVCPQCQTDLYILPVNVYPQTPSVPSEVIGGSFARRLQVVASQLLPGKKREHSLIPAVDARPSPANETTAAAPRRRFTLPKRTLPKIDIAGMLRRTFTPFRLLMLAMTAVVVGTSAWMWHRDTVEAARLTWRESMDQIPQLLAVDDFEQLSEAIETAFRAGRVLKRDGPEWRNVVNLRNEMEALRTVSHSTLATIILDACDDNGQIREDRADDLTRDIEGRTFIMDGFIDPAGIHEDSYAIDLPVLPGTQSISVNLDMPGLDEILEQTAARQLVFAFRCHRVLRPHQSPDRIWAIEVDPSSFVLMTQAAYCRRLGFPVDDDPALAQRLTAQQAFVAESESWAQRTSRFEQDNSESGDHP